MILSCEKGFTLLEVIAAIVVFAFGSLALYRLQATTIMGNSFSNELTEANVLAQDRMEILMALPYNNPTNGNPWLNDVDGDGTNQDTNGDGLDETGGNFGMDDTDGAGLAAADGCETVDVRTNGVSDCTQAMRNGIDYRIYFNIAVDQPFINTKTIRVIVVWRDEKNITHNVSLTSTKADII